MEFLVSRGIIMKFLETHFDEYIISNKALFFQSLLANVGTLQIPEGLKIATNTNMPTVKPTIKDTFVF